MDDVFDLDDDPGVLSDGEAAAAHVEVVNEIDALSDEELRLRLRDLEVEARQLAAETALVVAAAERRMVHRIDGHRNPAAWIRAETNCSSGRARGHRRLAHLLDTVPIAALALLAGRIGVDQADALAKARANPRCGDELSDSAELLIEWCEQLCYDDARTCIRRWEALADTDGAHRDRASVEEQRRAFVGVDDDGVAISASGGSPLVAEELVAIFERFVQAEFDADVAERTERFGPDAPASLLRRTDAQRRFDAFVAMSRAGAAGGPGTGEPARVVLNVISDARSVSDALAHHGIGVPIGYHGLGTDVTSDLALASAEPASRCRETESGLQLSEEDLVGIALNEHVRHVIVDSAGTVTSWGRQRRLFTGAARDAALFRVRRCERIGCAVRRRGCQVDHRLAWRDGGETDQDNADGYCSHDNRAKHELGIIVERSPHGYLNWHRRDGTYLGPVGRRRHPDHTELATRTRRRLAELVAGR